MLPLLCFGLVEFADRKLIKVDYTLINVGKHLVMRIFALFTALRHAIAADRKSAERIAFAAGAFPRRRKFKHVDFYNANIRTVFRARASNLVSGQRKAESTTQLCKSESHGFETECYIHPKWSLDLFTTGKRSGRDGGRVPARPV